MSEQSNNRIQVYEGPWRKLTPNRANAANEIHEPYHGKTGADNLDEHYGKDNWTFSETRFQVENDLKRESTRAANKIASEGLHNVIRANMTSDARGEARKPSGDTYVDNDGNRLTGRIERRTAAPALGDTLISPDGDHYFAETYDEKDK